MAIRWQTFALLAVLLAVGLVALLHPRPGAQASESTESSGYYEPTPAEVAQAFAALREPRGFARSTEHCHGANELCFNRRASEVMSLSRMKQWLAEAGLAVNVAWFPSVECGATRIGYRHPTHYSMVQCHAIGTRGNVFYSAQLSSLEFARGGHFHGTSRELGKPKLGIGGTNIRVSDFGVPRPEEVKSIHEALRREPQALRFPTGREHQEVAQP